MENNTNKLMVCPKWETCKDKGDFIIGLGHYRCAPHKHKKGLCSHSNLFCPPCVEFKLQVGDEVKVHSKSCWSNFESWKKEIGKKWDEVHIVSGMYNSGADIGLYSFKFHDLEFISRPSIQQAVKQEKETVMMEKPKYKPLRKELTLEAIKITALVEEFESFLKNYMTWDLETCLRHSLDDVILVNQQLIDYASKHKCFIKFLIDDGYVELYAPEVFYKVGDCFKGGTYDRVGRLTYEEDYFGKKGVILRYDDGGGACGHHKVGNIHQITQEELNSILGNPNDYKQVRVEYHEV